MSGWGEYVVVWVLFLASHAVPARPSLRARLVAALGQRGYLLTYSTVSLALLLWLLRAAGRAPFIPLWPMPGFAPWLVLIAMVLATTVLALTLGRPNPFSFGGGARAFDPANAGILCWIRHPILVAALLWSLAHLLANGDLAQVLLFGGFAIFSALGMRTLDRRNRRLMGAEKWHALWDSLRFGRPPQLVQRSAGAVVAVATLVLLHPFVAGVSIGHWFR